MPHPDHPVPAATSREKTRAHRERLRAQGMRPIQLWIPDTTTRAFHTAAHRQSAAVAAAQAAEADQAFIDAITA